MTYLPKRLLSFFMIAVLLFSTAMPLFAVENELPVSEESTTTGDEEMLSSTEEETSETPEMVKLWLNDKHRYDSSHEQGEVPVGSEIVITFTVPEGQRVKYFGINSVDKKDDLEKLEDGSYRYAFIIKENTIVALSFEVIPVPNKKVNFSFDFFDSSNARKVGKASDWSINPNFVSDFNKSFKLKDAAGNLIEPTTINPDQTSMTFENLYAGQYSLVYTPPYNMSLFSPYVYSKNGRSMGHYRRNPKLNILENETSTDLTLDISAKIELKSREQTRDIKVLASHPDDINDDAKIERIKAELPQTWEIYDPIFEEREYTRAVSWWVYKRHPTEFVEGKTVKITGIVPKDYDNLWDRVYSDPDTFTINVTVVDKLPVEVSFNQNYEGAPEAEVKEADEDGVVTPPENPVRQGFQFKGWFENAEGTGDAIDFATKSFAENVTVYAKWEEIETENVKLRFLKGKGTSSSDFASKELVQQLAPKFFIVNTETKEKFSPDPATHNTSTGFVMIKDVPVGTYSFEFVPEDPYSVLDYYQYSYKSYSYKSLGLDGTFELVKGKEGNVAAAVQSSLVLSEILPQDPIEYEVEIANDYPEANALIKKLKNEILPKTVKIKLSNGDVVEAKLRISGFDIRPNNLMSLGKKTVYSGLICQIMCPTLILQQDLKRKLS